MITKDNWEIYQQPNCNSLTPNTIASKIYNYDTAATTTIVYDSAAVFSNSLSALCPLSSCSVTQSDCSTALVAPFDGLISIDAADPWALRVTQTQGIGYPDVSVCYSCKNKDAVSQIDVQTMTNQVIFMQHINCAIGLDNNSTSLITDFNNPPLTHAAAYPFVASPEYSVLAPYTDSTKMFTNLNSAHCGGFTTCYPLPMGCTGLASAYTGFAKI